MTNYKDNQRVALICAGLAETPGLRKFWANSVGDAADALSTYEPTHRDKFTGHPFIEISVPTITWEQLGEAHPGPYHFINIDVEGMNFELLAGYCNDAARLETEMVCVEIDPASGQDWMRGNLAGAGFIHNQVVGGNLLAWK